MTPTPLHPLPFKQEKLPWSKANSQDLPTAVAIHQPGWWLEEDSVEGPSPLFLSWGKWWKKTMKNDMFFCWLIRFCCCFFPIISYYKKRSYVFCQSCFFWLLVVLEFVFFCWKKEQKSHLRPWDAPIQQLIQKRHPLSTSTTKIGS